MSKTLVSGSYFDFTVALNVWEVERVLDFFYVFRCPDDRMLYRLYVRYPRVFWHEAIAELNQV